MYMYVCTYVYVHVVQTHLKFKHSSDSLKIVTTIVKFNDVLKIVTTR